MKYDCVVMNPPYETSDDQDSQSQAIWYKFVLKAFDICKEGGFVTAIHPPGWRNVNGQFGDAGKLLKSKQIHYLDINSVEDGVDTFSVEKAVQTSFDWYVAENVKNNKKTIINDQEGIYSEIDLKQMPFIPNGMIDKIMLLIAKNGEKTCTAINGRTNYGSDKDWVSDKKDEEFIYPVVYSVVKGGKINLHYSKTNKNGHFGVPKVIWSNGSATKAVVDATGEYGLTQFAYAIIDDPENLEGI